MVPGSRSWRDTDVIMTKTWGRRPLHLSLGKGPFSFRLFAACSLCCTSGSLSTRCVFLLGFNSDVSTWNSGTAGNACRHFYAPNEQFKDLVSSRIAKRIKKLHLDDISAHLMS